MKNRLSVGPYDSVTETGAIARVGLQPVQGLIFEGDFHGQPLYSRFVTSVNTSFTHSVILLLTGSFFSSIRVSMNKLTRQARAQILHLLCEGQSIRAITRLTGVSKNTVAKLLVDAGHACAAYQDKALRNLPCKRVQMDEIWSFVYAKAKNVKGAKAAPETAGDVWTWTAICADTKLIVSWLLADRTLDSAVTFTRDLESRLANRVQLTSDG